MAEPLKQTTIEISLTLDQWREILSDMEYAACHGDYAPEMTEASSRRMEWIRSKLGDG